MVDTIFVLNESAFSTKGNIKKVITHECGHALGLSHVTCRESVMYPSADSKKMLSAPSNIDEATLCHVYNVIYK